MRLIVIIWFWADMGKRTIDLKTEDTLYIGDAKVQLIKKSGQLARICVEADNHIEIKHERMSASDSATETQAHGKYSFRLRTPTLPRGTD